MKFLLCAFLAAATLTCGGAFAAPKTQPGRGGDSCVEQCVKECKATSSKTSCKKQCDAICFVKGATGATSAAPPAQASTAPAPAPQTLASCDALFARARAAAASAPVRVQWSTNYLAHGLRFMGVTALDLSASNGDLVGEGTRRRWTGDFAAELERTASPPSPETVRLTIRADGKIVFQDAYGPYDPLCTGDRFAIVLSGDSVEVLNFGD